jgi:hypothetical protein
MCCSFVKCGALVAEWQAQFEFVRHSIPVTSVVTLLSESAGNIFLCETTGKMSVYWLETTLKKRRLLSFEPAFIVI